MRPARRNDLPEILITPIPPSLVSPSNIGCILVFLLFVRKHRREIFSCEKIREIITTQARPRATSAYINCTLLQGQECYFFIDTRRCLAPCIFSFLRKEQRLSISLINHQENCDRLPERVTFEKAFIFRRRFKSVIEIRVAVL